MRRGGGATERTAPVRVKVFVGAVPEADDEGSRADASSAHEVSFNDGDFASRVSESVSESLGLPRELRGCFGLHFVSCEGSVHRFEGDDVIDTALLRDLPEGSFLFTKVTQRAVDETALLKNEVSLGILFDDTEARVEAGLISPTDEQLERLDDFANPEFLAKRQYMELAHNIQDYDSVRLRACEVLPSDTPSHPLSLVGLSAGPISVSISPKGVAFTPIHDADDEDTHDGGGGGLGDTLKGRGVLLEFRRIRRWTRVGDRTPLRPQSFSLEYFVKAECFVWVNIRTDEVMLAEQLMGALAPLLYKESHPEWPAPKSMPRPRVGGREDNIAWFSPV